MLYIILFITILLSFFIIKFNLVTNIINTLKKIKNMGEIQKNLEEKIFKVAHKQNRLQRIKEITGEKPSKFEKIKNSIVKLILNNNHNWGFVGYVLATLICSIIGIYIGIVILNNFAVAVILAVFFCIIPYVYLEYKIKHVESDKNQKLLIVMGNLSSTYIKSETFLEAVEETIEYIPSPLDKYFKQYIYDIKYLNMDLTTCLEKLANNINNFYFNEFIACVIQAEHGETSLKYTIKSIPNDYQTYLENNDKYQKIIQQYNIDFIFRIITLPLVIGFVRIINKDYYTILTQNILGKITLLIVVIIYVTCSILFKKYNQEIKLEI